MPNETQPAPQWVQKIDALNLYLVRDLGGGPRLLKMAWIINLSKVSTAFVVAGMMVYYQNYSLAAWVYLALHGGYGLCWLLKHLAFRDPKWEMPITIGGGLVLFGLLATYWLAPYLLISGTAGIETQENPAFTAFCITLFVFGLMLTMLSDCQKYHALQYRRALITDGFFKYLRHPNYLGEMMLYAAFALLARHWLAWGVLAWWWTWVFLVNMLMIEASLSRYPEWAAYKARTGMLLPRGLFSAKQQAG